MRFSSWSRLSLVLFACATSLTAAIPAAETLKVSLPDDTLAAGIPGEGKLTKDQIEKFLADPKNHLPLEIELKTGLDVGASAISIPEGKPLTKAKIELGRQLFFDARLSADNTVACATCHDPSFSYGKDTRFGVGIKGQEGGRNSPVAFNRLLSSVQFWDGRADTLETQAKGPIANPIEMGNTHEKAIATVKTIEGYKLQFAKVFPKQGITIDTVADSIAAFERTLVTAPAAADLYEPLRTFEKSFADDIADPETFKKDDPESFAKWESLKKASATKPMSEAARRGRELFFSQRANCTACHVGANYTDEKYHNIGVGMDKKEPDLGRYEQTKKDADRGAFKTPTVRNVTRTAPYMHDGSQKTLEEVVEFYAKGGHPNPYLSDKIKKLELTDQDKKDLVEFMKALDSDLPKVQTARLP